MRFLAGLFFSGLLIAAGFALWIYTFSLRAGPRASTPEDVIFEVKPGQSLKQIADTLEAEQLISSAFKIRLWAKVSGNSNQVKVGEYALNTTMSPKEIFEVLISGKSVARTLTIAEGLNIFEIAELIEKKGFTTHQEFLKLVRDKKFIYQVLGENVSSLEGYLFPETYSYTKYTTLPELVRSMVGRFLKVYSEVTAATGGTQGWTRNQVVTLASIVEKETGAPEERPLISSVFHNRLRIHMRLQTDPTVMYGYWVQTGKPMTNITRKDLLAPHMYNTYVISGLPPGPIANPGRESLRAALQPAQSEYLYFVSKNQGTHTFSTSLKEHENAVRKFQIDPKAREGKSWRQLNHHK